MSQSPNGGLKSIFVAFCVIGFAIETNVVSDDIMLGPDIS